MSAAVLVPVAVPVVMAATFAAVRILERRRMHFPNVTDEPLEN